MALEAGDTAPDFTLPDQDGVTHTLSEHLAAGPVALFFYPAAMTPGCTAQSCHFRDLGSEFTALGAQRLGISVDEVAKQQQFSTKYGFDYPLLSDASGDVARSYGVKRRTNLIPVKRTTFVIGADGLIKARIASEIAMKVRADRALEVLRGARA